MGIKLLWGSVYEFALQHAITQFTHIRQKYRLPWTECAVNDEMDVGSNPLTTTIGSFTHASLYHQGHSDPFDPASLIYFPR